MGPGQKGPGQQGGIWGEALLNIIAEYLGKSVFQKRLYQKWTQ